MTPFDCDAVDALCAAATPGPWEWVTGDKAKELDPAYPCDCLYAPTSNTTLLFPLLDGTRLDFETKADQLFIAQARTLLPEAVARIRELEAVLAVFAEEGSWYVIDNQPSPDGPGSVSYSWRADGFPQHIRGRRYCEPQPHPMLRAFHALNPQGDE